MTIAIDYQLAAPRSVSASLVDGAVELELAPLADAAAWEFRTSLVPDPTGEPWQTLALDGSDQFDFDDNTTTYIQLRARNAADEIGGASNVASVTTPVVVGLAFKDVVKLLPATAADAVQPAEPNPTSLALDFAATDGLLVIAVGSRRSTVGTAVVTAGAATGYTELHFATSRVGEYTVSTRILTKDAVGGEGAIDVFDWSGGSGTVTNRAAFWVFSYTKVGNQVLYGNINRQHVANNPAEEQAVAATTSFADPLFVFGVAFAVAIGPTSMTYTGDTADVTETLTDAAQITAELRANFYDVDATFNDILVDMPDRGNANLLLSGAIRMAEL